MDAELSRPGSGEGLLHVFVRRDQKRTPDGKAIRGQTEVTRHTRRAYLFSDEINTLVALGARSASTLWATLRPCETGTGTGSAMPTRRSASASARIRYRLGLVAGIQPEVAGPLMEDAEAGTPQRFLMLPAIDPDAPDVTPQPRPVCSRGACPPRHPGHC